MGDGARRCTPGFERTATGAGARGSQPAVEPAAEQQAERGRCAEQRQPVHPPIDEGELIVRARQRGEVGQGDGPPRQRVETVDVVGADDEPLTCLVERRQHVGVTRNAPRTEGDLARPFRGIGDGRTDQRRVGNVRSEPQEQVQQHGQHEHPQLAV